MLEWKGKTATDQGQGASPSWAMAAFVERTDRQEKKADGDILEFNLDDVGEEEANKFRSIVQYYSN